MAYKFEDGLRARADQFVAALGEAGIQAAVVPGSFRDYTVKVSVHQLGRSLGNVNLYYSPTKGMFSHKTHELRDQSLVPQLEQCWTGGAPSRPAAGTSAADTTACQVYVDGSYLDGGIGYGAVILQRGTPVAELSGPVEDETLQGMRQVGGELKAVYETVVWCLDHGLRDVTVYYDYEGIEKWATGAWQANNPATQAYAASMSNSPLAIRWQKVTSHSGDRWNERADALAKQGARAGKAEPATKQAADLLTEAAAVAEGFVRFLQERGVEATYRGIHNNQFARVAITAGGYLDVYNTRRRSLAKPYLQGFRDVALKGAAESLWQEYRGAAQESGPEKTGLEEVAYYYDILKPYRDCAFDFGVLASVLDQACSRLQYPRVDVESMRYDFDRLERLYYNLSGGTTPS